MEHVERLPALPGTLHEERYLVRQGSELRVLWLESNPYPTQYGIFRRTDDWLRSVERELAPWLGFAHPRVTRVYPASWRSYDLAIVADDDRGPSFVDAAAVLADAPHDREGWAVAQIIAIAGALAAMARHVPGFVHRRLHLEWLYVSPTGRARLRPTIALEPRDLDPEEVAAVPSPHYFSAEAVSGLALTPASEVFTLAAYLQHAIAGVPAFGEDTDAPMDVLLRTLREPPRPCPTLHAGLDRVLARALDKRPEHRIPDPAVLAGELAACVPDAADYDAVISDRIAARW